MMEYFKTKILVMLILGATTIFAGNGQIAWEHEKCKVETTFIPQYRAVKIERKGNSFSLRYEMLVFVYCPTKDDYLNLKMESVAPIKINSELYRQEIKKIAPPVGNQGIDLFGSVMLDSISLVNCKNIQRLNDKKSFKVVSEGTCHVDVSAPWIHDGFDLKVNKEKGKLYFYINGVNVYKQ